MLQLPSSAQPVAMRKRHQQVQLQVPAQIWPVDQALCSVPLAGLQQLRSWQGITTWFN